MKINHKGIELIKLYEGCVLQAYPDPGTGREPWTIGFGHTQGVKPGMKITQQQAEQFLCQDLAEFEQAIADLVKVPLNENQFSALCSWVYNCGINALATSTLLKKLNAGDYNAAADELLKWDKAAGKKLAGLTRRREAERSLFLLPCSVLEGGKGILVAEVDTLLKVRPVQSAQLVGPNEKAAIGADSQLPLLAYKQEGDHIKLTLDGKGFGGKTSWYVYAKHVKILS